MAVSLKHFGTAILLAAATWILAFATIIRLDSLPGHAAEPYLLAALGVLFLPTLILGLWAHASPSLPTWSSGRLRLAWILGAIPMVATILLIGASLDPGLLILLLSLVAPLLALTGFWLERRRAPR